MKIHAGLIVLGAMLVACGGTEQETAAEAEDQPGVTEPMTDAIKKAEAVEDQAMQHKEAVDEAVDEAEAAPDEAAADE